MYKIMHIWLTKLQIRDCGDLDGRFTINMVGGQRRCLALFALAKALHTTPNYLLMGETEEDPWMEDVMQVLSEIKDPTMRKLAIDQLKCIARIS